MPKLTICRKAHFNAAHPLHNSAWTDEKNLLVFGKCNNPNYHGHNYNLVAKVTGELDPETGYVMDMKVLADIIDQEVCNRFDHKNLNLDTQEFKTLNPTAENIAVVIWNLVSAHLPEGLTLEIELFETDRNYVKYTGR